MITHLRPDLPALGRIDTPALIVDAVALQSNIERMAQAAAAHKVALRPHAKTHKSPAIARRQLAAGAVGICCATLLEAEAMAREGITGLLVTSPVVGRERAARIAALNRISPLTVVVDHRDQLDALKAAIVAGDPTLGRADRRRCRAGPHRRHHAAGRPRAGAGRGGRSALRVPRAAGLCGPCPAHPRSDGAARGGAGGRRAGARARLGARDRRHRLPDHLRQRHRYPCLGHGRAVHRAAGRLLRVHGCRLRPRAPGGRYGAALRARALRAGDGGVGQSRRPGDGRCRHQGARGQRAAAGAFHRPARGFALRVFRRRARRHHAAAGVAAAGAWDAAC